MATTMTNRIDGHTWVVQVRKKCDQWWEQTTVVDALLVSLAPVNTGEIGAKISPALIYIRLHELSLVR